MKPMVFLILGDPQSQARHRTYSRNNEMTTYDPSAAIKRTMADKVKSIMLQRSYEMIDDGFIAIDVEFHLPIPSSFSAKKRESLNESYCNKKPDLDNLLKLVMDALNLVVYRDDRLVCEVSMRKISSVKPCTKIVVSLLE